MYGVEISGTTEGLIFLSGEYYPTYLNFKKTFRSRRSFEKVEEWDNFILYHTTENVEYRMGITEDNGWFKIEKVNGVVPSSVEDLFIRFSALLS